MKRLFEILRQIVREAGADKITGEAAKAAYYFFLSFFPMILALFAFTGIFGGQEAFGWIMGRLRAALPGEASTYLERFVREITGESRPGMASLGVLLALWSASNIFTVLAEGLNRMYDLDEDRSWWKRKAIAVAALTVSLVLLSLGTAALLAGPALVERFGLGAVWTVLRWPLVFAALTLMMGLIYRWLPNRTARGAGRPLLIGSLVGSGLWVLATFGFRLYVSNFASYSKTYGFIGGIIVLLLWLYLTALTILFGGEVAATLEQLERDDWDVGKAPGRRVPAAAEGG